jgi:hypothetical protein
MWARRWIQIVVWNNTMANVQVAREQRGFEFIKDTNGNEPVTLKESLNGAPHFRSNGDGNSWDGHTVNRFEIQWIDALLR